MEITELEKSKMDSMKELADTNIKISEAKNLLFKLQEDETQYLVVREKKALEKIQKALDDSKELLDKTHKNYEKIHEFCQSVSSYADFLSETHKKFQEMLEVFKSRNQIWDGNAKQHYEELARQRKIVEQDTQAIEQREKQIKEAQEGLEKDRKRIESLQATLLTSYQAEKDLWEKIQRKN